MENANAAAPGSAREVDHTYAFIKTGGGNRYLKYAEIWGGFYIGFSGFPVNLVAGTYDEALATHSALSTHRSSFGPLQQIYRMSLPDWRSKVRLAVWNRATSCLEVWGATGQLQPFPRHHLVNLFNDCKELSDLEKSKEWQKDCRDVANQIAVNGPEDYTKALDHFAGASGYRFLPAKRLGKPIPSETIYAPIDTLSVLQTLNRRTFCYMTEINPPGVPWPQGIFDEQTMFIGPEGPVSETGYGRFVREYLDGMLDPKVGTVLQSLTDDQRMTLICATLNPMLVETAAMLFALDIGMVIDSGRGKGRQGIDVVAACGNSTTADEVIQRLDKIGILLHAEAVDYLRGMGTISFQCKGYGDDVGLTTKRLVEFRPVLGPIVESSGFRGIPMQHVLKLATQPQESGLHHLNAWLNRMCNIVVNRC